MSRARDNPTAAALPVCVFVFTPQLAVETQPCFYLGSQLKGAACCLLSSPAQGPGDSWTGSSGSGGHAGVFLTIFQSCISPEAFPFSFHPAPQLSLETWWDSLPAMLHINIILISFSWGALDTSYTRYMGGLCPGETPQPPFIPGSAAPLSSSHTSQAHRDFASSFPKITFPSSHYLICPAPLLRGDLCLLPCSSRNLLPPFLGTELSRSSPFTNPGAGLQSWECSACSGRERTTVTQNLHIFPPYVAEVLLTCFCHALPVSACPVHWAFLLLMGFSFCSFWR